MFITKVGWVFLSKGLWGQQLLCSHILPWDRKRESKCPKMVASPLGPLRKGRRHTPPQRLHQSPGLCSCTHKSVAAYRAPASTEATWGEGGYAKIRPGRAHAGEECPDTWSAAFGHQGQVQSWDGAEELLRSFDSTPNPHTQELPHIQPGKFPKTELRKNNGFSVGLCLGWGLTFCTTITTSLPWLHSKAPCTTGLLT